MFPSQDHRYLILISLFHLTDLDPEASETFCMNVKEVKSRFVQL